jgi:ribosomal 50S subunit-associated protein YjgA (DUF615 family)
VLRRLPDPLRDALAEVRRRRRRRRRRNAYVGRSVGRDGGPYMVKTVTYG